MNREAIHGALFTLCSSVTNFKLASRRLRFIDEVNPGEFPAIFLVWHSDLVQDDNYAGSIVGMMFEAWVYVDSGADVTIEPVKDVVAIVDALHNAIHLSSGLKQTLGGLVESCRIVGEIKTDGGTLGGKSLAIVPIKVLTTD
jgi:hypothetical protein